MPESLLAKHRESASIGCGLVVWFALVFLAQLVVLRVTSDGVWLELTAELAWLPAGVVAWLARYYVLRWLSSD